MSASTSSSTTSGASFIYKDIDAHLKTFPANRPAPFNASFHKGRREALLEKLPIDCVAIIVGATEHTRNSDMTFPFRQDSNFHYLTGFDEPDSVCILEKHHTGTKFSMIVPPRNPEKESWNGIRAGTEGAKETYGADEAYSNTTDLRKILERVCREASKHFLFMADDNAVANRKIARFLAKRKLKVFNGKDFVYQLRKIKTAYEVALIKHANYISYCAHMQAMCFGKLTHGKVERSECEIQAILEAEMKKRGAPDVAYPSIVGSGWRATILHYTQNNAVVKPGDLVLIDAGAEYGCYASDVTRTWPLSGTYTKQQRAVYDVVFKAHIETIKQVRPGTSIQELHDFAAEILTTGLVKLGIMHGDVKEILTEDAQRRYTMHSIGHPLGLDVHDNCDKEGKWKTDPLQPGMTFTIEPGIYIPANDQTVSEEFRGIGIRLEDNILVTNDGFENLTMKLPTDPAKIEEVMKQ